MRVRMKAGASECTRFYLFILAWTLINCMDGLSCPALLARHIVLRAGEERRHRERESESECISSVKTSVHEENAAKAKRDCFKLCVLLSVHSSMSVSASA